MAVNSVGSGGSYVSQVQPQPQTYNERVAEKEGVKSRDDAKKAAAVTSAPKPTVNTEGQTVGAIISTKA